MPKRSVLGLFTDENVVADAMDALKAEGYTIGEYDILSRHTVSRGDLRRSRACTQAIQVAADRGHLRFHYCTYPDYRDSARLSAGNGRQAYTGDPANGNHSV